MEANFNYGKISYKPRFSINRPLDDYSIVVLDRVISVTLKSLFYRNMKRDQLCYEIYVIYRDSNFLLSHLSLDLHDFTFSVLELGDMKVII